MASNFKKSTTYNVRGVFGVGDNGCVTIDIDDAGEIKFSELFEKFDGEEVSVTFKSTVESN